MTMPRIVTQEILDHLEPSDPEAIRSRADLRLIHRVMGTCPIVVTALSHAISGTQDTPTDIKREHTIRILELGSGDGSLMLGAARELNKRTKANAVSRNMQTRILVELMLLDQHDLVSHDTIERFAEVGWQIDLEIANVLDWATPRSTKWGLPIGAECWDIIVANLFMHHFQGHELEALLLAIQSRTRYFFACEPRRGRIPLMASHLIGVIGVNAVTRNDAVASVKAGFCDNEISALWHSDSSRWKLREYSAGLFSHCFFAERLPSAGNKH